MDIVVLIGTIAYFVRLTHKLTGLLFLWWRKEYRIDRMFIHLKTKQGVTVWGGKTHMILVGLLFLSILPGLGSVPFVLLSGLAVLLAWRHKDLRTWHLPPISPKVMGILVAVMFFGIVYVDLSTQPILVSLVVLDLFLFPLTMCLVLLLSVPTGIYHRFVIHRALKMLRAHAHMTVVGITGSYGKTSVKDYLATILESQFAVLKTEASKNSPIGIAEVILRHLSAKHDTFVVEMAAYTNGEIAQMCTMVTPEIGILTAINSQHQDLFGSIENTMKAKYELALGLSGKRLLIANADDPRIVTMAEWAMKDGCSVWWYSTQTRKTKKSFPDAGKVFRATNIISDKKGISFDCVVDGEKVLIKAPVVGSHQASNILAAFAGSVACGMTVDRAALAARSIRPAKKVMELVPGVSGSVFVDDTFNNNPEAALAAINFLSTNSGKKILVFQPMIELGNDGPSAHEKVGEHAGAVCDEIYLTNGNFFEDFRRGVRNVSEKTVVRVSTPKTAAARIKSSVTTGDMVLFKGKDAEHTLNLLKKTP